MLMLEETFILGGIDTKEDYFHSSVVLKNCCRDKNIFRITFRMNM